MRTFGSGWFRSRKTQAQAGWAVLAPHGEELAFVHGEAGASPGAPGADDAAAHASVRGRVTHYALRARAPDPDSMARAARELGLGKLRCALLLEANDYQLLALDAPNAPRAEWKTAALWRVKDLIDYPVEDAVVDVLEVPEPRSGSRAARQMLAVAARASLLGERIRPLAAAGVPVSVVDIPEIAQRNLSALCEESGRALAMLYFDAAGGLLTVTFGGELCMSRRFDVGVRLLTEGPEDARAAARDRVLLELQRSLDHFERQRNDLPVSRIVLGPEPVDTGLSAYLAANLALRVASIDLAALLEWPAGGVDPRLAWRLFHLFGASLRDAHTVH